MFVRKYFNPLSVRHYPNSQAATFLAGRLEPGPASLISTRASTLPKPVDSGILKNHDGIYMHKTTGSADSTDRE